MASVYDLLTGVTLEDSTYAQLEQMTERSYVDKASLEFWKGVFQVSKAQEIAKTAPHGLPLPSHSGCTTVTIADTASGTIKPTGTEVWLVQSINEDNCVAFLYDGTTAINISSSEGYIARTRNPIFLTSTCYLMFNNPSGSEQTPGIAYHKVSL
jgi:hypothetical protein